MQMQLYITCLNHSQSKVPIIILVNMICLCPQMRPYKVVACLLPTLTHSELLALSVFELCWLSLEPGRLQEVF